MQQAGQSDNKEEDGDGLPRMRNSLCEQPKAQKHEYVMKAPVTPAVCLCSVSMARRGEKNPTGYYMRC